jgi:hypothetical protein
MLMQPGKLPSWRPPNRTTVFTETDRSNQVTAAMVLLMAIVAICFSNA